MRICAHVVLPCQVPVPKAVLSAVGDVIDRTIAEPFLTKDDVEV